MKKLPVLMVACFVLAAAFDFSGCNSASSPSTPAVSTPTPVCTSPTNQGLTSTGSLSYYTSVPTFNTQAVTFASAEIATSISFYVGSGPVTGQIRFAIYGDNGSFYPGNLVIETMPQNIVASTWNTASLPNVYLPAGIYWMAYNPSNNLTVTYNPTGGTNQWIQNYGWSVFPDTYPTGLMQSYDTYVLPLYLTTCP